MRYSSMKHFFKKKIITAFTLGFVTISMLQPITAKAETTTDVYQAQNPSNMLGTAADFGIFVQENVRVVTHCHSNIACSKAQFGDQNGISDITPVKKGGIDDMNAINYLDEISSDTKINNGYLYLGKGNVTKNAVIRNGQVRYINNGEWNVDGYIVAGNGLSLHEPIIASNYIDLDSEFIKLSNLAANLYKLKDQNVKSNLNTQNSRSITATKDYSVINISAADLTSGGMDALVLKNIRGNKQLIINVNMDGVGKTFNIMRQIKFDSKEKDVEAFDKDACNIIWNFNSYDGTIQRDAITAGVILAPKANVNLIGGNHIGIVIAKNLIVGRDEVHYVPFDHTILPVEVSAVSVNGNCCPSKPLPGTEFQLYTKTGKIVADTVKKAETVSSGESIATWSINQPGEYYIQEINTVEGYIKTPVKARFDVVLNNGKLKVITKPGKEANGYSVAWDEKTSTVKIRHYSNEVVVAAFDRADLTGVKDIAFTIENERTGEKIFGTSDDEGLFIANIPESGFYTITQNSKDTDYTTSEEKKQFVIYYTPIGHQFVVELDSAKGNEILSILNRYYPGTTQMKKLTKAFNDALIACGYKNGNMTYEYEAATDTCIVFLYNRNK